MARRAPDAAHARSDAQYKTLHSLLTQQAWFLQHTCVSSQHRRGPEKQPHGPSQNAQAHSCSRIQFYNSEYHTRALSDRQLVQLVLSPMSGFSFAAILFTCLAWLDPDTAPAIRRPTQNTPTLEMHTCVIARQGRRSEIAPPGHRRTPSQMSAFQNPVSAVRSSVTMFASQ